MIAVVYVVLIVEHPYREYLEMLQGESYPRIFGALRYNGRRIGSDQAAVAFTHVRVQRFRRRLSGGLDHDGMCSGFGSRKWVVFF